MSMSGTLAGTLQLRTPGDPGSNSWSFDVLPVLAYCNIPDHHGTDSEALGQGRVGGASRGSFSKKNDGCFSELGAGVPFSTSSVAKNADRVLNVLDLSAPFEVLKTVVKNVAVFMIGLKSAGEMTGERAESQPGDGVLLSALLVAPSESDVEISAFLGGLGEYRPFADVLAPYLDTDATSVGDGVQIFVARDRYPLLHNANPIMAGAE